MNKNLEIISVNYNTPDLTQTLIESINTMEGKYPIRIIDGSDKQPFIDEIKAVCDKYDNVTLIQKGWNIHHGRGMDLAVSTSEYEWCLIMDSDAKLLKPIIEHFTFTTPYEGVPEYVNRKGINETNGEVLYLHPSMLLVNVAYYNKNEFKFIHHGAPAIQIMSNEANINKGILPSAFKQCFDRGRRGTVNRFGYQL